ncbi:hypothetical protein [Deinococcus multiflagellatus]|uniref:Uncharacterized protein n=1 Tax=Deinococcus multiflagellatus TaxID=1656887 RepID=A0ABW1ZH78_9DEIO
METAIVVPPVTVFPVSTHSAAELLWATLSLPLHELLWQAHVRVVLQPDGQFTLNIDPW